MSEIYEQHIRALPAAERLKLVAMIASELATECETLPPRKRVNLSELRGLGKEIWEGVDAQEYADKLRGPWPDEVP